MTPSQALARSLQIVIKVRARQQEKSIQKILLHYAFTLSPFVEATAPGICTVQFTKWHRHPADNQLARHGESVPPYGGRTGSQSYQNVLRVIEQLTECEIRAQAGIAVTPDTSFSRSTSGATGSAYREGKRISCSLAHRNACHDRHNINWRAELCDAGRGRTTAVRHPKNLEGPLACSISGSSSVSPIVSLALQQMISHGLTLSERHWRNRVAHTRIAQQSKRLGR